MHFTSNQTAYVLVLRLNLIWESTVGTDMYTIAKIFFCVSCTVNVLYCGGEQRITLRFGVFKLVLGLVNRFIILMATT